MHDSMRSGLLRVATVLMIAAACGCGDGDGSASDPQPAVRTGTFVGTASGTTACVAVVAGTEAVVAFVNDAASGLSLTFGGPRGAERTEIAGRNGSVLAVEVHRKRASGTVTIDGEPHGFVLSPAQGTAGLYRTAGKIGDEPVWAGWVIQNDGSQCATAATNAGVILGPALDTSTQTFAIGDERFAAVKVEPDVPAGDIEDPGTSFAGGSGFSGGVQQFGGFSQFGFSGFSSSFTTNFSGFNTGFSGGFNFGGSFNFGTSFGGKNFGFGGGGFNPGWFASARPRDVAAP
jgi:hypothetical protein